MNAIPAAHESTVPRGAELTVYWPDDDQWYHGVVMTSKPGRVHVEYEDGSQEWIHMKSTEWKLWNKSARKYEEEFQHQKKKRVESLKVGSRLCVFWPLEKTFFSGTLVEIAGSKHLIRYDDGDEEWTNLFHRKFQKVSNRASRLQVGSRIVIHSHKTGSHPGEKCHATVVRINIGRPKPHCVKYDCPNKKQEWLNLNDQPFHEIQQPNPSQPSIILKKRKQEFLQDIPELQIGRGWKTKIQGEEPSLEPGLDQVSTSTTVLTPQSSSTPPPITSLVPEHHSLTARPIPYTPNLTTTIESRKKKKQSPPRRLGKLTTKMLMNYMIRGGCNDDSSAVSRVVSLQDPDIRFVSKKHSIQYPRR